MNEIIRYIIMRLAGDALAEGDLAQIGYTADRKEFAAYRTVIYPSDFFAQSPTLPALPLACWEGIPLLFGSPKTEKIGDTVVLYADIVASAFFLLSRCEETLTPLRDTHGRFRGKDSLPFRAGFLHRPVVDEYGRAFRQLLREIGFTLPPEAHSLKKIYLTHDVDTLARYRSLRALAGSFWHRKNTLRAVKTFFGKLENDTYYTFPFLFTTNKSLQNKNTEQICFILQQNLFTPEDRTNYRLSSRDFTEFVTLCKKNNVTPGLHTSYSAGKNPARVAEEKLALEKKLGQTLTYNRYHYLACREPKDYRALTACGITDDFTMAYADVAGFRLGTCHPVRFIDIENQKLTSLVLHPLTVMDCTLSDKKYMNLSKNEAFEVCKNLITASADAGGELTLLWHNTSVSNMAENGDYHRTLYKKIIDFIQTI